jgi:hypothetical protein
MLGAAGFAQPCNPVIDGTYCATLPRSRSDISTAPTRIRPIQNIGEDFTTERDQPATLGAITFGGNGTRCIGLLRRGSCN